MDYFTVSGQDDVAASDVDTIARSAKDTGLVLNPSKCEIVCANEDVADKPIFEDYIRLRPENITLLGTPILRCPAADKAISAKIDDLARAISCLTLLHAHDGLIL